MSEEKKTEDDSGANPTSSQRENLEVRPVAPETTDGEKGVKVARLFVWFERFVPLPICMYLLHANV